jgi:hypothetical protein
MALTSVKEIPEGSLISFKSKKQGDQTVYQGVLESQGTFRSIKSMLNPQPYNEAVRQSDRLVPSDVTLLTYFVITVDNKSEKETMIAFANEWIAEGSLKQVSLGNKVTLTVDDPSNDPHAIVSLLASAGYASKIIS